MVRRFEGRTALVTGASRGIGFGVAQRLVSEGASVVITARRQEALEAAVEALGGPTCALAVAGKADDPVHQDETIRAALETFGRLDYLVNNTGINPTFGPVIDLDLDIARKIVEVNAISALAWTQKVYRATMADKGGAIVNMSSISSVQPAPGIGFYGASKAMLNALTELLAVELAPGVRVNAVAPSVVKTRFATALYEGREAQVAGAHPLQRLGVPADVAGAVAFLLSDDASWVTGQTVLVDGGLRLAGGLG